MSSKSQSAKKPKSGVAKVCKILLVAFICFIGFRVCQLVIHLKNSPPPKAVPGKLEFSQANKAITTDKTGAILGNDRTAVKMANDFSERLLQLRNTHIESGEVSDFSPTAGELVTFCHLTDESCVFLVHLSGLRHFTEEAQHVVSHLAWRSAHETLKENQVGEGIELAVGVRGLMVYSKIFVGTYDTSREDIRRNIKTRKSGLSGEEILYQFFATDNKVVE
ncbi:MAG: hypothetical protein MI807_01455 [Verrucomicrobiales bacterium]|nr:hypothetical protein [Verrucomicrobiales bacterium]